MNCVYIIMNYKIIFTAWNRWMYSLDVGLVICSIRMLYMYKYIRHVWSDMCDSCIACEGRLNDVLEMLTGVRISGLICMRGLTLELSFLGRPSWGILARRSISCLECYEHSRFHWSLCVTDRINPRISQCCHLRLEQTDLMNGSFVINIEKNWRWIEFLDSITSQMNWENVMLWKGIWWNSFDRKIYLLPEWTGCAGTLIRPKVQTPNEANNNQDVWSSPFGRLWDDRTITILAERTEEILKIFHSISSANIRNSWTEKLNCYFYHYKLSIHHS